MINWKSVAKHFWKYTKVLEGQNIEYLYRAEAAERREERLREALYQIDRLASEWNSNNMGKLELQRKRWQKLGQIAHKVIA